MKEFRFAAHPSSTALRRKMVSHGFSRYSPNMTAQAFNPTEENRQSERSRVCSGGLAVAMSSLVIPSELRYLVWTFVLLSELLLTGKEITPPQAERQMLGGNKAQSRLSSALQLRGRCICRLRPASTTPTATIWKSATQTASRAGPAYSQRRQTKAPPP